MAYIMRWLLVYTSVFARADEYKRVANVSVGTAGQNILYRLPDISSWLGFLFFCKRGDLVGSTLTAERMSSRGIHFIEEAIRNTICPLNGPLPLSVPQTRA